MDEVSKDKLNPAAVVAKHRYHRGAFGSDNALDGSCVLTSRHKTVEHCESYLLAADLNAKRLQLAEEQDAAREAVGRLTADLAARDIEIDRLRNLCATYSADLTEAELIKRLHERINYLEDALEKRTEQRDNLGDLAEEFLLRAESAERQVAVLPKKPGKAGQVMVMGENNEMVWQDAGKRKVPLNEVDPELLLLLRRAGNEWGPLGVANAAAALVGEEL